MDDLQTARPPTAELLGKWRARLRLTKQRLSELADVSATYVRNIEAGFDEAGRPVVPSATVIQKLARGLARAEPDEARRADLERRAYAEIMGAAGYLPSEPADASTPTLTPWIGGPVVAPSIAGSPTTPNGWEPSPERVGASGPGIAPSECARTVTLRDRRLARHLQELLDNWETLASEDQALLLGISEFLAERRRRREGIG